MEREKHHVLIVDDNINNLQLTARVLMQEGYKVSLAKNGHDALKSFETSIPDIILLDIMMPEMDGIAVCKKMKADKNLREIPVIFLTAKSQTEDLVEGFKAGGADYVIKPFNRDELLVRLQNHLDLALARKRIMNMVKTREKLYSIIAHDIKSPFASISLTIEVLKSGLIDPGSNEFKEIMEGLEKTTRETTTLIENLLDWTKIDDEQYQFTIKMNNISKVIEECINLLKPLSDQKNITIEYNICENCQALFDEVSAYTIFRNLILNAIKFSPDGAVISVTSRKPESDYVEISVKDNGTGIPQDVIDVIFKSDQYHTSMSRAKEKGTGLGLFLVKDFLKKNNGKISAESHEGRGTTVKVSLPAK